MGIIQKLMHVLPSSALTAKNTNGEENTEKEYRKAG